MEMVFLQAFSAANDLIPYTANHCAVQCFTEYFSKVGGGNEQIGKERARGVATNRYLPCTIAFRRDNSNVGTCPDPSSSTAKGLVPRLLCYTFLQVYPFTSTCQQIMYMPQVVHDAVLPAGIQLCHQSICQHHVNVCHRGVHENAVLPAGMEAKGLSYYSVYMYYYHTVYMYTTP